MFDLSRCLMAAAKAFDIQIARKPIQIARLACRRILTPMTPAPFRLFQGSARKEIAAVRMTIARFPFGVLWG
jgi:hypothetical protein